MLPWGGVCVRSAGAISQFPPEVLARTRPSCVDLRYSQETRHGGGTVGWYVAPQRPFREAVRAPPLTFEYLLLRLCHGFPVASSDLKAADVPAAWDIPLVWQASTTPWRLWPPAAPPGARACEPPAAGLEQSTGTMMTRESSQQSRFPPTQRVSKERTEKESIGAGEVPRATVSYAYWTRQALRHGFRRILSAFTSRGRLRALSR